MARRRYQRKQRGHDEVELNMTAMLDMAFQLLAFFVLTFKPGAVESQLSLRMPLNGCDWVDDDREYSAQLPIRVIANASGDIREIHVNNSIISGEAPLDGVMAKLDAALSAQLAAVPFGSVALEASRNLTSERLLQVMDVCTKQIRADLEPLTKISVAELPDGP